MTGEAETSAGKTSKDPQRGSIDLDELKRQIDALKDRTDALKDRTAKCLEDVDATACTRHQHMKPGSKVIESEPREAKKRGRQPGLSKNKANSSSSKAETEKIHPAIAFAEILCGFYQDEDAKSYIMEKATALAMVTAPATTSADASASTGKNKNKKVQPEKPNSSTLEGKPADHQKKEYETRGRTQKITKQRCASLESEFSKLQAQAATNKVMKTKKRGRPRKFAQQPEESLEPELRDLEEDRAGGEPKKKKARSGWPRNKPRNLNQRLIWEQEQVKRAAEKAKQQLSEEIEQQQPDLRQQNRETPQQQPEIATEIQTEEVQPAIEIHDQQPETQQEMQLEEEQPIMKSPKEPRKEEDGNKKAICIGLANIMLHMTKISGELAKLIIMFSGGSQEE